MNEKRLENIIASKLNENFVDITWEPISKSAMEINPQINVLSYNEYKTLESIKFIETESNKDKTTCNMLDILNSEPVIEKLLSTFVFKINDIENIRNMLIKMEETLRKTYDLIKSLRNEFKDSSDSVGLTLLYDIVYNIDNKLIEDETEIDNVIQKYFNEIEPNESRHKIVNKISHKFDPNGLTIVYILSESSLVYHTYVEKKIVTFDFYTCKSNYKFDNFIKYIDEYFKTRQVLLLHIRER